MAMFVTLYVLITVFCSAGSVIGVKADKAELRTVHRQKREWVIPPRKLYENVDYTNDEYIAKIRSDEEVRTDIEYSLIGAAVDDGLFSVGRKNGHVRIHGILDRENTAVYELKGRALLRNGSLAERDLDLNVIVLDQNDNPPVFTSVFTGSVDELSEEGTYVITVLGTDADEENTPHSQIAYKIIQQEPAGASMFKLYNEQSGQITVRINNLDRETVDTYRLIVTGTDMNGQPSAPPNSPLTGTGTVTINIRDVNDNVPTLEKSFYEASVEENTANVEVIRIKALDDDEIHTENWEAVYTIISGNEAGYFTITTDPKTNEGIVTVTKELNYEELKEVNLKVAVRNKATYHKSVVIERPVSYPVKINVVNVPEAPHFQPGVKVISISEDRTTIDFKKVITTYTATDSDTLLTATNVRYVKGQDADNWVSIDEKTAEIRLNKFPDRESKFLVNGTYYANILCITNDFSPKTATGTLAIQVQDFNDHCPVLTSTVETLCYGNTVVYVTATDVDGFPNAEPFEYHVVTKDTKESWSIERLNETSVILRSQESLWPGHYTVGLDVQDQQGKSCEVQKVHVTVCTCTEENVCKPEKRSSISTVLGAGGALALLLGILLLLLIPMLLLFCNCGGGAAYGDFQAFPFEHKQHLITYNSEGQGEDKELALLSQVPVKVGSGGSNGKWESGRVAQEDWRNSFRSNEEYMKQQWYQSQGKYAETKAADTSGHSEFLTASNNMALSESYLGNYYGQKIQDMVNEESSMNHLLVSDYETCNSVTGSLEDICCHLHEDNLDFLNGLGPQFKRLAEICSGSTINVEVDSITKTPGLQSKSQVDVKVDDAAFGASASTSSSINQITTTINEESVIGGGATSVANIGQTLLVQQPTVYLTSTPMYIMEQQPTLYLASAPVLGVQESNLLLVENASTNMAITAQNTIPQLGLQQAHTKVLVEPCTVVHGFSGHHETPDAMSSTVRVVESQRVESMAPARVVQRSSRSSVSEQQSLQAKGPSRDAMALGNVSVIHSPRSPSQHGVFPFSVSNGGTRQEVREERVSVVEKSFKSSSAS